jgi:hypothetical protein
MNSSRSHQVKKVQDKPARKSSDTNASGFFAKPPGGLVASTTPRNALLSIPKNVGLILPDRLYTALRYFKLGSISLATVPTGAFRYRPTAAFDVDPLVGGTTMAGFSELAGLYGQYRVTISKAILRVVNPNPVSPCIAILAPQNIDPGSSPSAGYVNSLLENPYAKHKTVGISGSPVISLNSVMSTEKIFGSTEVYVDDNFRSDSASVPVNNWFWVLGFTTANLLPNPIQWDLTIDVGIEFYDRLFLFQ